jgi:hypothetical protein
MSIPNDAEIVSVISNKKKNELLKIQITMFEQYR